MRLTIYDDGLSCPNNCDAHVVFSSPLNGTEFAHNPATPHKPFSKCTKGGTCRLCIESGGKQCLEAVYRGGGPAPMTFDFTPAFYAAACEGTPLQGRLAAKCAELRKAAKALEGRLNCIAEPNAEACKELIATARKAKSDDMPRYKECIAVGETTYNNGRANEEHRSNRCAYELHGTGGPNSKGTSWRKLLPGACRAGTFVGRDGLDCCSGNLFADGPVGLECRSFYPGKKD
ncbi:hypothetical protein [Variovorax sp. LT2P21]|uniref:hypothetical protein n=1 Tax=Variovorax sp. LT2P21 TaxID=3443731 RepID=UPI003F490720